MRVVPLALAGLAGCFNPTIESGAFRCAEDDPKCPEGQSCCEDDTCRTSCEPDGGAPDLTSDSAGDVDAGKGPPALAGEPRPDGGTACPDDDLKGPDPVGNSTFDNAAEIDATGTVPGGLSICWPGDVDYYKVALAKGDRLRVTVDFVHAMGDLDGVLQSPLGEFLVAEDGTQDDEVLDLDDGAEAAGEYRIAVYGYQQATNTYNLVLAVNP